MDIHSKQYIKVPRGHVWLQGDNLACSIDSRDYGPVPEATLKGRVLARVTYPNSLLMYFRFRFEITHTSHYYQIHSCLQKI